ncbi:hypothetical protein BACFIN_05813, partial [Bacteroides finegoldii DSM 17565]
MTRRFRLRFRRGGNGADFHCLFILPNMELQKNLSHLVYCLFLGW